jgi:hypothetical protein
VGTTLFVDGELHGTATTRSTVHLAPIGCCPYTTKAATCPQNVEAFADVNFFNAAFTESDARSHYAAAPRPVTTMPKIENALGITSSGGARPTSPSRKPTN